MNKKYLGFLILVAMPFDHAIAERFCFLQAETPYEQDYCTLEAEGAKGLPEFFSFRRNTPQMQHLLLKPYAKRMGIKITPEPKKKKLAKRHPFARDKVPATSQTASIKTDSKPIQKIAKPAPLVREKQLPQADTGGVKPLKPEVVKVPRAEGPENAVKQDAVNQKIELAALQSPPSIVQPAQSYKVDPKQQLLPLGKQPVTPRPVVNAQSLAEKDAELPSKPVSRTSPSKALAQIARPAEALGLEGCQQQGDVIECRDQRFRLMRNRANSDLDMQMFESGNQLGFSTLLPSVVAPDLVNSYLMGNYERYLAGMNRIGLIEASMSYSKFKRLFHHIREAGADFPSRFETMYRYLKKDKKVLAVKVGSEIPTIRVEQCLRIGANWLSCQAGKHYVFRLES